jgi:hypothetical protein
MLQLNLTEAIQELKKLKAKKILIQIPEGLKAKTEEIVLDLEKKGMEVIVSMDPCPLRNNVSIGLTLVWAFSSVRTFVRLGVPH